jgi:hypothetical protein
MTLNHPKPAHRRSNSPPRSSRASRVRLAGAEETRWSLARWPPSGVCRSRIDASQIVDTLAGQHAGLGWMAAATAIHLLLEALCELAKVSGSQLPFSQSLATG